MAMKLSEKWKQNKKEAGMLIPASFLTNFIFSLIRELVYPQRKAH